jgi:hypothetical protein
MARIEGVSILGETRENSLAPLRHGAEIRSLAEAGRPPVRRRAALPQLPAATAGFRRRLRKLIRRFT